MKKGYSSYYLYYSLEQIQLIYMIEENIFTGEDKIDRMRDPIAQNDGCMIFLGRGGGGELVEEYCI